VSQRSRFGGATIIADRRDGVNAARARLYSWEHSGVTPFTGKPAAAAGPYFDTTPGAARPGLAWGGRWPPRRGRSLSN